MIIEEIKNIKSTRPELRKFGLTMGIVLGFLGGVLWWRGRAYFSYLFIFSVVFLFLGLFIPGVSKFVQKVWMPLAAIMGWVMTRVILIILFYLILTPTGFLARLFGQHFLDLKFDKSAGSYWITRKNAQFDKKRYESQF